MSSTVLRNLLSVGLIGFCVVLAAPKSVSAQARTWHYNSNNYTQPGSFPFYSGAPNRQLPFWRRPAAVVSPAVVTPGVYQPAPMMSPGTGCGMPAPTASYYSAPNSCASGCTTSYNPGGMTQTVGYVPQTVYRTVYRPVPVTRYQPVAACGPCGQSVTAYRPVTSYAYQSQRVAMTSYLAVPTVTYRPATCTVGCTTAAYANSACATGACGTTTAGYYAPTSSCSTCAPASTLSPSNSGTTLQPTPAPELGSGTGLGGGGPEKTFKTNKPASDAGPDLNAPVIGVPEIQMGKEVKPSAVKSGMFSTPRFLSPQDQTTQRHRSFKIQPAVHSRPVELSQVEQDAQGWEAVSGK